MHIASLETGIMLFRIKKKKKTERSLWWLNPKGGRECLKARPEVEQGLAVAGLCKAQQRFWYLSKKTLKFFKESNE